tara:strand:+ start:1044 stop:1619 length:576 start_codon:yes stop_codon:yes gene_type:complete
MITNILLCIYCNKTGTKEVTVKGIFKVGMVLTILSALGACSTMKEIEIRETKANPKWYLDCKQAGSEGWLFWKTDYAYSCGMGESKFEQASEAQAYAFAVKGYAERINGTVNSSTVVDINNDVRTTRTVVEHKVQDTVIREHLEVKRYQYELGSTGRVHTYVRIKMPLDIFERLIQEAKDAKVLALQSNNG